MNLRPGRLAVAAALLALLVGCTPTPPPEPTDSPSPSPTPREFTVLTSGPLTTTDPAAATNDTDTLVATSIYQRLMRVLPDTGELKPDAATDCIFVSQTTYECELQANLKFHNGDPLTAADVRFSIRRALRLNTPGTAISMFDALDQISTPDDKTVRFRLKFADAQFGYALASVAGSIVNSRTFDADVPLDLELLPVGSGPYAVAVPPRESLLLTRFQDYRGPTPVGIERMVLAHTEDSVSAEAALLAGEADVVWRTLDEPALSRLTAAGFTRWAMPGLRAIRLAWNPDSERRADAKLRSAVALALQQDRTLDSLVPVGVGGHVSSFPVGGRPELPEVEGARVILTLGYDPTSPGAADLARTLRDRIETVDGLSVRVAASGGVDLALTDKLPWVATAPGWLQDYLDHPLPDSATALETLEFQLRTTSSDAERTNALTRLQEHAAADLSIVPVAQNDGILVLAGGLALAAGARGSGGVLGLWGIHRV